MDTDTKDDLAQRVLEALRLPETGRFAALCQRMEAEARAAIKQAVNELRASAIELALEAGLAGAIVPSAAGPVLIIVPAPHNRATH